MAFRANVVAYFKNLHFPSQLTAVNVVQPIYVTGEAVAILEHKYYAPEPLCYLRSVPPPPPPPTCKRCGREGHIPLHCIAKYDVGGEEID
jgi:hypothetical protein